MKLSFLQYLQRLITRKEESESKRKRELLSDIGLAYYDWAQEFFSREKLNTVITIRSMLDDYNDNPDVFKHITTMGFKIKLKKYCELKGFKLNPDKYINSTGERIIQKDRSTGSFVECVFIKTH